MRAALPLTLLVAACAPEYVERDTQLVFDPASSDFWALPIPSDLRLVDGAPDFDRWPGDWDSELVAMWLLAANERVRGWGLSTGGFFVATDDIDPTTLTDESAFLVDIDPVSPERGKRFPLERDFRSVGDLYSPDRLLSLSPVPGHVRR